MTNDENDVRRLTRLYHDHFDLFAYRFLTELAGGRGIQWNWHHEMLCHYLMRLEFGDYTTLVVNMPPRTLKSEICSIAYPAWLLMRDATRQIIGLSYEETLSHAFARGTRQIMRSPAYKAICDTRISPIQFAADEFETTAGGKRLARSVGGAVTGRGADVLIFDDLAPADHAVNEAARLRLRDRISNTLLSRGNSLSGGKMLLVMQRLHEDDATGQFLEMGGCEHLVVSAIATKSEIFHYHTFQGPTVHHRMIGEAIHPERDPVSAYRRLERSMSPADFAAQYQQNPIPSAGNIIKRDWFPRYGVQPERFEQVIQAWDTASKADEIHDYSACVTFGRIGDAAYIIDVFRARLEYPDLKREVRERARIFQANKVVIEDAGSGQALLQDLQREGFYIASGIKTVQSKVIRVSAATSMMQSGGILLPHAAMWLDQLLDEATAFPAGKHDDMVDALTHGITWMKENPAIPHIASFYKQEIERARIQKEVRNVKVQNPNKNYQQISNMEGKMFSTNMDGVVMLSEDDALPFLQSGWSRLT